MKYYLTQEGKELIKEYMGPVERGVQMWGKTALQNPDSQAQLTLAQKRGSQAQAKRKRDVARADADTRTSTQRAAERLARVKAAKKKTANK